MADRKGKAEADAGEAEPGSIEGLVETAGQKKARETFEALAPSGHARARHPDLQAALVRAGEIFNGVGSEHQESIWRAARKARKRATRAAAKKYGEAAGSPADAPFVAHARARAQSLEVAEAMAVFAREVPGSAEAFRRVAEGSAESLILAGALGAAIEGAPALPRPRPMVSDPAVAAAALAELYRDE